MKAKWLIESDSFWWGQPNRFTPALEKLKVDSKIIKFKPEGDYQDHFEKDSIVILKGSLEFVKQIEKIGRYKLAFWDGIDKFKCSVYYSYYGEYMANGYDYCFLPLEELRRKIQEVISRYGNNFFIRPDSGGKEFTGHVVGNMMANEFDPTFTAIERKEHNLTVLNNKLKKYSYGNLSPEELVMITFIKKIDEEYRFFIVDREVIAGSTYMENGSHEEKTEYPKEAFELAERIAKIEWRPAVAFAVDVCKINGTYKVLEINSFNCSDIYACDPEAIIQKASEYVEKLA